MYSSCRWKWLRKVSSAAMVEKNTWSTDIVLDANGSVKNVGHHQQCESEMDAPLLRERLN
jgi:hypothetical protein